jgi:hypothetical protein
VTLNNVFNMGGKTIDYLFFVFVNFLKCAPRAFCCGRGLPGGHLAQWAKAFLLLLAEWARTLASGFEG